MALLGLSLSSFLAKDTTYGDDRWTLFAKVLAARLTTCAEKLDEKGLSFESETAEELQEDFAKLAQEGCDADDFATAWNDLEQWCEQDVSVAGKELRLCSLPRLPDRFAC